MSVVTGCLQVQVKGTTETEGIRRRTHCNDMPESISTKGNKTTGCSLYTAWNSICFNGGMYTGAPSSPDQWQHLNRTLCILPIAHWFSTWISSGCKLDIVLDGIVYQVQSKQMHEKCNSKGLYILCLISCTPQKKVIELGRKFLVHSAVLQSPSLTKQVMSLDLWPSPPHDSGISEIFKTGFPDIPDCLNIFSDFPEIKWGDDHGCVLVPSRSPPLKFLRFVLGRPWMNIHSSNRGFTILHHKESLYWFNNFFILFHLIDREGRQTEIDDNYNQTVQFAQVG